MQQRGSGRARGQRSAGSDANTYENESGNESESESENVGRHSGQGAQGRGVRRRGGEGVDLEEDEEDGTRVSRRLSQRRQQGRRRRGVEYELDEDEDEDGYENDNELPPRRSLETTARSRDHAEELLFQRRQSAHSQLPQRHQPVPSRFTPEYDLEIRGQERRARRSARDGGLRRRQSGSGDAPPRYEDHVFDRVADDDDDDDA